MASASSNHRAVQCTQDSLLDDRNSRHIPPRPMAALPNNTSSPCPAREGGDRCDCPCWKKGHTDDSRGSRQITGERHPTQCSQESTVDAYSRVSLEPTT